MKNKILKRIKRSIPTSIMILMMLVSCSEGTSNSNTTNNNINEAERVNFNEVLKNLTIGFDENFNDSVLVSEAVSNAKLLNQEITVIIELDGKSTIDTYLSLNSNIYFPEFNNSKQAITQENQMVSSQANLAAKLLKEGLIDEVNGNYSSLLNGFSAKTTYGRIDQIRSFANVKNAYVSTIYKQTTKKADDLSSTVKRANDGVVNNETNVDPNTGIYENNVLDEHGNVLYDGSNTIVAVLDSGFDYTHEVFSMDVLKPAKTYDEISDLVNATSEDGSPLLRAKSFTNDLSVDDVYLSSKVPFAYDYADKKTDVFPIESDHGTHVSGIIGGYSDEIKGIAPQTQFAWMKVFNDDDGGGDSADILTALEDSILLGVDAINMSLGAVGGYSLEVPIGEATALEDRTNKIYSDIQEIGISLLTAAGNEYSSAYQSATGTNLTTNPESGTISSPGSYEASLTVGSINGELDNYALANNSNSEAVFFKNAFDSKQVEHFFIEELFRNVRNLETFLDNPKWTEEEKQVIRDRVKISEDGTVDLEYITIPGTGIEANYIPVGGKKELLGRVALVERGSISFEEKLRYANNMGAFAVLIYNNVSGSLSITVGQEVPIPVALIPLEAGSKLAERSKGTLKFNETYKAGPFMSDFSSWGPLANLKLKPEITAHGGNIYSATLGGTYDKMSGTSMATPNTCGIVLVIRDYVKENADKLGISKNDQGKPNPKEVTNMVNRLLMSTANICINEVGNPYSPRKQGAGLASLSNSVTTNAYLYVEGTDKPKLELGDDKERTGVYVSEFNINNFSNKALTYIVGNYTQTETVASDEESVAETPYMLNPNMTIEVDNELTLSSNTLTVPANTDATIKVTLTLSKEDKKYLEESFKNGMYIEGFVTLNATDEKEVDLNIPFLSFYGNWLDAPMFDVSYYEVEADRVNASISEKDKTTADMFATTPYGKYADMYMIPLGSYIYEIDPGYEQIPATIEKAAISIDEETAIYELYTIYTGMLRGAKKLTMTITNETTGEVVYEKTTYNNRKATFYGSYGSILPYNDDYSFAMFNEETGEIFANNTKFTINMTAELDYENGDQVANNSYEFSFYVDYETPTVEGIRYITEWDKTLKENRYYIELDVSDNRFVQAIRPCVIVNNSLLSLTDNPIPVYQQNANEMTTVKVEITDYFDDLKESEYSDTIFFMISDYALNSNIFMVPLAGCDYKDLAFNVDAEGIKINAYEAVDLNSYVNYENATLQGMTWRSDNENIAIVDEGQIIGINQGITNITGISPSYGTTIRARVIVTKASDDIDTSYIEEVKFSHYNTLFSFDDDFEYSQLGKVDPTGLSYSYMPDSNMFELYPSESFKLNVKIDPWYYDASKVTIKWSSANENYVSVTEDGVVTALAETVSPVTIRATAYIDGKETVFSASTSVSVKSPFVTSGIVLQYYKGFGGVVDIPDDLGIEYIGEYAFTHYNYAGVDWEGYAIRIPQGDRIDAPLYSTPITKIIIPEGVKIIQTSAFMYLESLEEVVLPSTAKDIYVSAFEGCISLKSINLNTINKIENYAFNGCTSLVNVNAGENLPGNYLSNIVTMGRNAFKGTAIEKIDLKRLRMANVSTFEDCVNLKEVTLYADNPLSVNMFKNSAIETITIPHSYIPSSAFEGCVSIESIKFTNEEVVIDKNAFKDCNLLSNITFENTNQLEIGTNAFENSSIKTLNLPSCEVVIYDEAFKGSLIEELVLNENTTLIFEGAPFVSTESFNKITSNGCTNYVVENNILLNSTKDTLILVPTNQEAIIPNTVKTIEAAAISGNKATSTLIIPSNVTTIKDFAFANSHITSVDLSALNKVNLGDYLFYGCEELSSTNSLDTLLTIPEYMFAFSGLTNVTLADNVVIGYGAFAECSKLERVTIGENATIGDFAFYKSFNPDIDTNLVIASGSIGNSSFASSYVKNASINGVTSVGEWAFNNANNLTSISLNNVKEISMYAFYEAKGLVSIEINNANTIHPSAFALCESLETVVAEKLNEIGDEAFFNDIKLINIDLKDVTYIGNRAFYGSSSLNSVDLSNINYLGDYAFAECNNLKSVNNLEKSTLSVIPANLFFFSNAEVYPILDSINLSNITEIHENAFYGNYALKNVNLEKVEKIGDYAFYGTSVSKLTLTNCKEVGHFAFYGVHAHEITIPVLVSVGECAFAETHASKLVLPDSLETIHYGSFSSISNLKNFEGTGKDPLNHVKYDEHNNKVWEIIDGVLYKYLENGKLQLQSYPVASERIEYRIVDGTYRIDSYSFYTNYSYTTPKLKTIYIPYSVKSIGDTAFGAYYDSTYDSLVLKTIYFESYEAPVLEGVYNYSLIDYMYALTESTEKLEDLYFISERDFYNMYFYYYPYYYCNFGNYVGLVEGLTMYYPENGIGYNSWIYRNYFDNKETIAPVADNATNKAIEALNSLIGIDSANNDNKDHILSVYDAYVVITDDTQLNLLDENKVNHLLDLYNQVINLDYPELSADELNQIVGTFTGNDDEGTKFDLTINADGTGTFVVDHQTNDDFDKNFTFNKVRHHNDTTLQITTNDGTTFTFVVLEDGSISLKYYVSDISLTIPGSNEDNSPNNDTEKTPNILPIILGSAGGFVLLIAITFVIIFIRKRKTLKGGN